MSQPGDPKLGDFATLLSEAEDYCHTGWWYEPPIKLNPAYRRNARLVAVPQTRRMHMSTLAPATAMQLLINPATKDQAQQAILAHAFEK